MLYLFFLIICLNIEITWGEYAPVVRTNSGMVRGIVLTDKRNGKRVHLYKGIKYGDAKRFQKPTPAQPWTGVYSATTTRYACPQPYVPAKPFGHQIVERSDGGGPLYSSEECLFLNVFKPEEGSGSLRAVMVWIHGGTNLNGNSYAYDARYIVSLGDVVVVTINYRLGALGYLIGATEEYPGNLALYDMTLALKWVQQNAAHFGGDARLVTVFGESSGSMAVGTLILSPLTKGLFRRAILQSGAPNQFTGSQSAKAIGEKGLVLAAKIGCPVKLSTAAMIMACLERANVVFLQGEVNKMAATNLFVPSFGTEFLPDNPAKLLKAGRFNTEVDLLYGSNRDEGNGVYASNPAFNPYRPVTITFPMIRVAIWKVLKAAGPILARQTNQTFQWYTRGLTEDEDEDKLRKIPARVSADQV